MITKYINIPLLTVILAGSSLMAADKAIMDMGAKSISDKDAERVMLRIYEKDDAAQENTHINVQTGNDKNADTKALIERARTDMGGLSDSGIKKVLKGLKIPKDKALSDTDLNKIFLSFFEEWKRQKRIEDAKRRELLLAQQKKHIVISQKKPHQTIKTPSLQEQFEAFKKSLASKRQQQKGSKKNTSVPVHKKKIFGTLCKERPKKECLAITEIGYLHVGEKINGSKISVIDRYRIRFANGKEIVFIIE